MKAGSEGSEGNEGIPRPPHSPFPPLIRDIERQLVSALGLSPLPIAPGLARAEGTWKERPVTIETRAYRGGPLRYARFVTAVGEELEIGNVLCLSVPEEPLPIFGADLVARLVPGRPGEGEARWQTMVAADLSPTHPEEAGRARQLAGLERRLAPYRGVLPSAGELPAWCARWFSSHAVFTRPPAAQLGAAVAAVREMAAEFVCLARVAGGSVGAGTEWRRSEEMAARVARTQDEYAAAHRADDKGLTMLARMFGAGWAGRYVEEILFPDSSGGRRGRH